MCRLFGFHSVLKTRVHQSLVAAENALLVQSKAHPDGWGISYYLEGVPHIIKNLSSANQDSLFRRLGESLCSHTVVAHVRRATQGDISLVNCHPFQYGNWVMAHNGDCPDFNNLKNLFLEHVNQEFKNYIFGNTDSEIFFAMILTEMMNQEILRKNNFEIIKLGDCILKVADKIKQICADNNIKEPVILNFIISNGSMLIGHKYGKELSFSSHKISCAEFAHCAYAQESCIQAARGNGSPISHLLISSEPLIGENIWEPMRDGELVGVDHQLKFFRR